MSPLASLESLPSAWLYDNAIDCETLAVTKAAGILVLTDEC